MSSYPAQPGEEVLIIATGLGDSVRMTDAVKVQFGDFLAVVDATESDASDGELYLLHTRVPFGLETGNVPVRLKVTRADRELTSSDTVAAIER
jgi:hypothetical protein